MFISGYLPFMNRRPSPLLWVLQRMGFFLKPSEMQTRMVPGVFFLILYLNTARGVSSGAQSLYSVEVESADIQPMQLEFLVLSMSALLKKQQMELRPINLRREHTRRESPGSYRQNFCGKNRTLQILRVFLCESLGLGMWRMPVVVSSKMQLGEVVERWGSGDFSHTVSYV